MQLFEPFLQVENVIGVSCVMQGCTVVSREGCLNATHKRVANYFVILLLKNVDG